MLYVSVRWSRLHSDIRRRSVGRIGRIVAIVGDEARSDTQRHVGDGGGVDVDARCWCNDA
jgi:hypothetical protein